MDAAMSVDFKTTCRLCLYQGSDSDFLHIFSDEDPDMPSKIQQCVSLEITNTEELPTLVCFSCVQQINQWLAFKEVCHNTNLFLQEMLITRKEKEESQERKPYLSPDGADDEPTTEWPNSPEMKSDHLQDVKTNIKRIRLNYTKIRKKTNVRQEIIKRESEEEDDEKDVTQFLVELEEDDVECRTTDEYKCDICSTVCDTLFDYLDHQKTHDGQPVFNCERCLLVFNSKNDLVEHESNHRNPCPVCGKMMLATSMRVHLISHTDAHKCDQCQARFANNLSLASHIAVVHGGMREHICENCGKRCSSKGSLITHLKSHSDVRAYPCKLCDYAGRTASALYIHMARHENSDRACAACGKKFRSFRSVRDHMRRVHSAVKKHVCTFCQKKFVDKYMLTVHMRTHTGARPYQCDVCEKGFVRSDGLKEHRATHGQRASYECGNCGKKFTYRRSLSRHSCAAVA